MIEILIFLFFLLVVQFIFAVRFLYLIFVDKY